MTKDQKDYNKQRFEKAVSHIEREGFNNLVSWLENDTDFFSSPASAIYHGNYEGGLLEHTLNVLEFALTNFNYMVKRNPTLSHLNKESVIIVSICHDLCKCNVYKIEEKWTKNQKGKWIGYEAYRFDEDFPLGHGEKSLYLTQKYINLTQGEALAIRWHMGTFDPGASIPGVTHFAYKQAWEHPLVKIIHAADIMATTLEKTIDYKSKAENS